MGSTKRKQLFLLGDAVAILLVALLSAGLIWAFFASGRGQSAEIVVENTVVATLSLSEDAVYPVEANGHHLTVRVERGEVQVVDADCPDKVCEHTGRVSRKGASIVCAAARVTVRVVGGGDRDVDFVAG